MKILIFISMMLLVGCVTPPQTTSELRQGFQRGAMMTKVDKKEVGRPVNEVFQDIKRNADKCFNIIATGSTPGTYGPVNESTRYRSNSRMTSKTMGEMVIQMDKKASGKMPEGGYFALLTDMESTSRNRTRVTVYGSSVGYNEVFEAIFDWSNGKNRACPNWMR